VKRYCGDDSWGVAPCQNSSMPSLLFHKEVLNYLFRASLFFLKYHRPNSSMLINGTAN
jgi:hypothetical protein